MPHSLRPSLDVGVVSRLAPKLKPDTVTLHPAVMPAFKLSTKLTTGAMVAQNNHAFAAAYAQDNKRVAVSCARLDVGKHAGNTEGGGHFLYTATNRRS